MQHSVSAMTLPPSDVKVAGEDAEEGEYEDGVRDGETEVPQISALQLPRPIDRPASASPESPEGVFELPTDEMYQDHSRARQDEIQQPKPVKPEIEKRREVEPSRVEDTTPVRQSPTSDNNAATTGVAREMTMTNLRPTTPSPTPAPKIIKESDSKVNQRQSSINAPEVATHVGSPTPTAPISSVKREPSRKITKREDVKATADASPNPGSKNSVPPLPVMQAADKERKVAKRKSMFSVFKR